MNLRQRLDRMIAQWDGLDALERSHRRQQLVSNLMTLLQKDALARRDHSSSATPVKPRSALVHKNQS